MRKGEHYEQVQKEYLENEIRIKERRERRDKYDRQSEQRERERDRERRHAMRDRGYDPRDADYRQMGRADRSRSRFEDDRRRR